MAVEKYKEKERLEENGEQIKRQVEALRDHKTGILLLLIKFESYPYLRC